MSFAINLLFLCISDPSRLRLAKWSLDTFGELVAEKLKAYERETKELGLLLFPEVRVRATRVSASFTSTPDIVAHLL